MTDDQEEREVETSMGLALTRPAGGAQADSDDFRRYEAALRSYFRRRAPAPQVADLVQAALARLIANQQDTPVQTPLAYLFRIASNLIAASELGRVAGRRRVCQSV